MKSSDSAPSLTPQRKHRKLLKDGSGVEVWPESIENTFVQGLREYWQSPYATYSQSRGRSRWRNQFLVDYLQRHGISRTKKQVASHIQVLRNMWKGQPEFHLVAGGDEVVDPVTHIPIKEEGDTNTLVPFDWEGSASPSASPEYSPPDSHSDFPLTPEQRPNLYPGDVAPPLAIKQEGSPGGLYSLSSPNTSPFSNYSHNLPNEYSPTTHTNFKPLPTQQPLSSYPYPNGHQPATTRTPTSFSQYVPPNRITKFCLYAEGMTPFSVNVDALAQSAPSARPPPLTLRIKLSVPTLSDPRSPPNLHGFNAAVIVANPWSASAKCSTKVYSSNNLVSEEDEQLRPSQINQADNSVQALIPESHLSRCRWLDHNTPTVITQELSVDDQTLLFLIFELDRKNGPMPCSEFLGFQHFKAPAAQASPSPYSAALNHHRRMSSQLSNSNYPFTSSAAYSIPSR